MRSGDVVPRPDRAERAGEPVMIRRARAEDLGRIGDIEQSSFTDPWSRRSFRALLDDARVLFAVAVMQPEVVVGYVVAWFVADEGEIGNLAVASDARRTGVGGLLLDAAIAEGRARGAAHLYLDVRESNIAARALYRGRGFGEVGRRKRYYRSPDEDGLVLRRSLEESGGT